MLAINQPGLEHPWHPPRRRLTSNGFIENAPNPPLRCHHNSSVGALPIRDQAFPVKVPGLHSHWRLANSNRQGLISSNPVSGEFECVGHFYGLATRPSDGESVNPSPLGRTDSLWRPGDSSREPVRDNFRVPSDPGTIARRYRAPCIHVGGQTLTELDGQAKPRSSQLTVADQSPV